jgi:hypothetical protein
LFAVLWINPDESSKLSILSNIEGKLGRRGEGNLLEEDGK